MRIEYVGVTDIFDRHYLTLRSVNKATQKKLIPARNFLIE
jgi:hypothetical protein